MSAPTAARSGHGVVAVVRAIEAWRLAFTRPGSLVWTRNVNHRGGSALALLFVRTRVSANVVTVAALAVATAAAAYVGTRSEAIGITGALVVAATWQLAFCLDCADGQLARARGTATPFGAWLDQLCDFLAHAAVFTSVTVYLARQLELSAVTAVLLLAGAFGANLLQLFASSQRNHILGAAPAADGAGGRGTLGVAAAGRHLSDWGPFLLLVSFVLPYPRAAATVVAASAVLAVLTVAGQVAVNWRRELAAAKDHGRAAGA